MFMVKPPGFVQPAQKWRERERARERGGIFEAAGLRRAGAEKKRERGRESV